MAIKFNANQPPPKTNKVVLTEACASKYHPRWVSIDPTMSNIRMGTGYALAKKEEVKHTFGIWQDGAYRLGDVVLMLIDKEVLAQRRAYNDYQANEPVRQIKDKLAQTGGSLGRSTMTLQETLDTN